MLEHKIDFMVTIEVREANANGDPLSGNMPRTDAKGHGLISDVAIKRKIRNRMQDFGCPTFVQAGDRIEDEFRSLEKRFSNQFTSKDSDAEIEEKANQLWMDVRSFGQVFTYLKKSIGVRGPVSLNMAKSLEPIVISSLQITRSTNGMEAKNESGRSSDTMGTKHFVDYGVYVIKGSINPNFAEKTGFSDEDAEVIKKALISLFENDASSARPEGSMRVREVFWFTHSNKLGNVSSARVFDLIEFDKEKQDKDNYDDYSIHLNQEKLAEYQAKGLKVDILEGL
ncbi:type I-C CRISPR-associated protein Cas7/Csd2 [Streptococcus constellatus]|uniref:PF05107 family n=1 Tax=Streptococcus constellatus subsp. constellatus SK53 TaxID=1095730 RepID=A0AAD2SW03_STRCV|nr:type I-C CRISPR-associated protein Cas7/Csd2 [Streptococcus constellatus]EID21041.1 PF05107 family [Streptococcus constellatus subsp. constellatus SK53]MDP1485738.1 type I-C CRISPR-associated protein Cas7/Csd2 [Streptococcus constellatus]QQT05527.1 type I-C CRISPR-associated protein Cas7/Csd2 [Streptococcus constellatus]SUN40057.1 Csd2 family CRISPR-associated protein [Streptococcus constellatus]BBD22117.1 CRISPR-associated protein [Streptococcus constellatus subsp. constellatus]